MAKRTLIHLTLAPAEGSRRRALLKHSWFLSSVCQSPEYVVLAFMAADHKKDPKHAPVLGEIEAKEDGTFDVELTAELPDRLPMNKGKVECAFELPSATKGSEVVALSNQMLAVRFTQGAEQRRVTFPIALTPRVVRGKIVALPAGTSPRPMKTTASSRFTVRGTTAEEALSSELDGLVDQFFSRLNRILDAYRVVLKERALALSPMYDRFAFEEIFMTIRGREPKKFGVRRLVLSPARIALRPNLAESSRSIRRAIANAHQVDPSTQFLYQGRSLMRAGMHPAALLYFVIAAETKLAQFVELKLRECGVSDSKLEDTAEHRTFSLHLNTYLDALTPPSKRFDRNLLGQINLARKHRNDFMHEGRFKLNRRQIEELEGSVRTFCERLSELSVIRRSKPRVN